MTGFRLYQGMSGRLSAACAIKKLKLCTMGHMALELHINSAKHLACSAATRRQAPISQFCVANSMLTSTVTSAASSTEPTQPGNIRALCGSKPALKAEVTWTLKMILDHHSYTSNKNISELFKVMFPNSEIAATFTCGSNKTAYITKFGLAPFITKQLTEQVNKASGFVLMPPHSP